MTTTPAVDGPLAEAEALHAARRRDEAEALCRRIVADDPQCAPAWSLLGIIAQQRGNPRAAIAHLGRALALDPQSPQTSPTYYVNRGVALLAAGDAIAAGEHFVAALKLRPDLAEAHLNLGNALARQRKLREAAASYREAIAQAPEIAEGHFNLGLALQALGDADEAIACFRRALALRPDRVEAYYQLSRCKRITDEGPALVREIGAALARPGLGDAEAAACHFALGKVHDDLGEHAAAFGHYDAAKRLERRHAPFDRAAHKAAIDATIATFTAPFLAARKAWGSSSQRPVFIVGMPRSGTTLVEQMLASHSRVYGAGELEFWLRQRAQLAPARWAMVDRNRVGAIARDYLRRLDALAGNAPVVTDKMPHNFLCLGSIHLAFPHAHVVHCRRDPADTCLSIYFQRFTRAHGYANDLDDLAFYYREYARLMEHWRGALPAGVLHELRYEDLVANPEATLGALLAALDLPWEPACLEFYRSERRAATPSDWQVRQPIYGGSVGRWRRYAGFVAPLAGLAAEYAVPSPMPDSRPWLRFYGKVPPTLDYPEVTLYEAVVRTAERVPDTIAWDFLDTTATYRELVAAIDACADALATLGLGRGHRILISMPTTPQGVIAFYAANKLGAVAALIHPLSTRPEIEHYLAQSRARIALTLDAFYDRFAPIAGLDAIVLARIADYLPPLKRLGFWLAKGRKIPRVPADPRVRWWSDLMASAHPSAPKAATTTSDPAAILFSGGTTGMPKGIVLSNRNFITEGMMAAAWCGMTEGHSILAILPIFHGFGLGVCVNAALMAGGRSILVPVFDAKVVAKLLRRKRPNALVGVPTLYDALTKDPSLQRADLSSLSACFCGADTLPRPVKERFEALVRKRGGNVRLLEGYGLTEAVTGIAATPLGEYREGSVGVPFPDMLAAICAPGTTDELPPGEEGEICVSGPAVMLGYLDDPEATREALREHADGRVWLHTGDIGKMDTDGFLYFTVRLKRMIKSSGFNVYPAQVESALYQHPQVAEACVYGIPDPAQVERVVASVVLKDGAAANAATEQALIEHCRERLIKWSCPREIEFRRELPKTRVGKIDYKVLAAQRAARDAGGTPDARDADGTGGLPNARDSDAAGVTHHATGGAA